MAHTYSNKIKFDGHSKEKFDTLLDQVKIISIDEYNEEAKDGFQDLCNYWDDKPTRNLNYKIKLNAEKIKHLVVSK